MVSNGMKLPTSLVSTAPEEFQPQVPTGKLSKTQKKKLKKKAKLQNELIKKQMEHLQQIEQEESKGTKDGAGDAENHSATAELSNNDESPTDNETSSRVLNGSMKSNASSENEEKSNEDNEEVEENMKMSSSPPSERVIDEELKAPTPPPIENGLGEHLKRSPKGPTTPQGDPTFEVCEFEVKIADLGNACWVEKHFTEGKNEAGFPGSCLLILRLPQTSRHDNTALSRSSLALATTPPPTSGARLAWPSNSPPATTCLSRTLVRTTIATTTTWRTSLSCWDRSRRISRFRDGFRRRCSTSVVS
jgi:hypothetical protein